MFSKETEDLDSFVRDEKTKPAIIKLIENIGEAIKKIPREIKSRYRQVPWEEIAGMRDILAHEYFGIDAEVIWKTIKNDLFPVKAAIKKIREDSELKKKRPWRK